MPAPKVSAEEKARALAIYAESGPAEASRQTGIPRGTVSQMARRAGVTVTRSEQIAGAVEAAKATMAQRRAELADIMLREAQVEMQRLRSSVRESRVSAKGDLVQWEEPEPSPADRRAIATTAAILVDKSNLLSGEATSRSETLSVEDARKRLSEEFPGVLKVVNGGRVSA